MYDANMVHSPMPWKAPKISEVRRGPCETVEKYPEDILSSAESWFEQNDAGHLWCIPPPCCPDFRPIELFWGDATNYDARTYEDTRDTQDMLVYNRVEGVMVERLLVNTSQRRLLNCKRLNRQKLLKVKITIERDGIIRDSVERVLEHIPSSCKVSLESGSSVPERWSEVELLKVGFVDTDASDASEREWAAWNVSLSSQERKSRCFFQGSHISGPAGV